MCMLGVCNQINFNLGYLNQHKRFSSYKMDLLSSFPVAGQAAKSIGLVLRSQTS